MSNKKVEQSFLTWDWMKVSNPMLKKSVGPAGTTRHWTTLPNSMLKKPIGHVSLGLLCDSRKQEWGKTRFISREIKEQR
jgi:hypothetical protein